MICLIAERIMLTTTMKGQVLVICIVTETKIRLKTESAPVVRREGRAPKRLLQESPILQSLPLA